MSRAVLIHKRLLTPLPPPPIRRPQQPRQPLKQPPPLPQKPLRHLPPRNIPGRGPRNDATSFDLIIRKPLVQPADAVSPQVVLVKGAGGADEAVAALGTGEQVDPVAVRDCLLQGGGQEGWGEEEGLRGVGDGVDGFVGAGEGGGEDAGDEGAVDGEGAEGVELEEGDEVVWTEGEDDVEGLFSGFSWQQGISRVVDLLDMRCWDDGEGLLLNVPAFHQRF